MTSAYAIAPIMTVILLHINTPFMILLSKYIFPERIYNSMQLRGTSIIALAVLFSIIKSFFDKSAHMYSTLFFVFFSSLQSISTLYKEKLLIEFFILE